MKANTDWQQASLNRDPYVVARESRIGDHLDQVLSYGVPLAFHPLVFRVIDARFCMLDSEITGPFLWPIVVKKIPTRF